MKDLKIEKQSDGGYIVRYADLNTGGVYSGGLDGAIKFICSYYEYPVEYLIEDLTNGIPK